jgi:hypothetical protein
MVKGGILVSILCGGLYHPDYVTDSQVEYSIPKRRFYEKSDVALLSRAAECGDFTVFYKMRPNLWRDLGRFKVSEIIIREDDILFDLHRISLP